MAVLPRPVPMIIFWIPEWTASSTPYWMMGLSTIGSISLGGALVAGRNRVPSPAAGNTALRTLAVIYYSLVPQRPLWQLASLYFHVPCAIYMCLDNTNGIRNSRTLHRHQGHRLRRRLPGRLHSSEKRRAQLRGSGDALHRPGGMHRLRRVCSRLPGFGDLRSRRSPGKMAKLHAQERRLLRQEAHR